MGDAAASKYHGVLESLSTSLPARAQACGHHAWDNEALCVV